MASKTTDFMFNRKKKAVSQKSKTKIPFKFDVGMLEKFIGFIFKNFNEVNKKSLMNMKDLVDMVDMSIYESNPKALSRIQFVKHALDAKLKEGYEDESIIINYCRDFNVNDKEIDDIANNLKEYKKISPAEIKFINNCIEERLRYSFILKYKDSFIESLELLESGDYRSFKEITDAIVDTARAVVSDSRKCTALMDNNVFSLDPDLFDSRITDIVNKLKDPSAILTTGIQMLNEILSPGYMGGRLYIYLGLPAGYKSMMLIKTVRDIKKYNASIKCREGMKPCVLFVTMENGIEETVERLFNMNVTSQDIRDFTPKQVIQMLKEQEEFKITTDNEIDIVIRYYHYHSIDTFHLYTLIDDLADQNKQCIALVLDYIKRIRPSEYAHDEKQELKNVTNELKTLAVEYNIPVITAHQLNRTAATAIDAAITDNKQDLARFLGRGNTGSAWEVNENVDWQCIVNVEQKRSTGDFYLTFKRTKIRYREKSHLSYFNHPFVKGGNKIQLVDDIDYPSPISELSLAEDFDGVTLEQVEKPLRHKGVLENSLFIEEFDESKAI